MKQSHSTLHKYSAAVAKCFTEPANIHLYLVLIAKLAAVMRFSLFHNFYLNLSPFHTGTRKDADTSADTHELWNNFIHMKK